MPSDAVTSRRNVIISTVYAESRNRIYGYILKRIASPTDAEDLTQDVFTRLMEYNAPIDEDTTMNLLFSIAHNIVIDYLRRNAHKDAVAEYFFVHSTKETECTEQTVLAADILNLEEKCLARLPQRRQEVYSLCTHFGYRTSDVAEHLNLSRRTVESHLYSARKQIRKEISLAI